MYSVVQGWRNFLRVRAQIVYKFKKIPSLAHENYEEQSKIL